MQCCECGMWYTVCGIVVVVVEKHYSDDKQFNACIIGRPPELILSFTLPACLIYFKPFFFFFFELLFDLSRVVCQVFFLSVFILYLLLLLLLRF